jgi:two-component system sensor histidine kinase CpxA
MTQATEQIAEGRFDAPVQAGRRDELGRLGQAINRMAARLSGYVSGQKRFLGDTAHELCSPIARIQVALGILEQRADDKQKAYVEDVREEAQQMSSLVNELLSFSRIGLQQKEIKLEPVNLAATVRKVLDRESVASSSVTVEIENTLSVLAEPELLQRALANLIRNALRYAGLAGPILLSAASIGDRVSLTIADSGPGVPKETLEQIFDPFFRVESSRSRDSGGVGLGLAIVKTCVEACQGTVSARNRQPIGLQIDITLKACKEERT